MCLLMPFYKRLYFILFYATILIAATPGCRIKEKPKAFVIGFSQCIESDAWRQTMLEEMKRELSFRSNVTLLYRQADGISQVQIKQVRELLNEKIDLLIISPNEAQPLTPVVEETFHKGIPVIVVDRKISTSLYSAYVGGNNYEIGRLAGDYAAHLLGREGNIIEITGLPKSSPAIERGKGFADALKKYPQLKIVQEINGEWLKERAESKLDAIASAYTGANLVFAHNDRMALATYEVYKKKGLLIPKIIGVDGLSKKDAGL